MIELGFQNWILLFVFCLGLISSFVIRWKWNKSVERKKEIMRLVAIAADEAARAELQANAEYQYMYRGFDSVPVVPPVVRTTDCAVCHSPTTTRCARCKAVKYCSGKCQIIHWRQGHKDECHPPSNTLNGPDSGTGRKTVSQGDQPEVNANHVESRGTREDKPIEISAEGHDPKTVLKGNQHDLNDMEIRGGHMDNSTETHLVQPHSPDIDHSTDKGDDVVGKVSFVSDNFRVSSPVEFPATTMDEPLVAVPLTKISLSNHGARLEEPLFSDIPHNVSDKKTDVNGIKLTQSRSEFSTSSNKPSVDVPLTDMSNSGDGPEESRFSGNSQDVNHTKVVNGITPSELSSSEYSTFTSSADGMSRSESTSSSGSSIDILSRSKFSELPIPNFDYWETTLGTHMFENGTDDNSTLSSLSEGGEDNLPHSKSSSKISLNTSQQEVSYTQSQNNKGRNHLGSPFGVPHSEKRLTDLSMRESSPTVKSEKPSSRNDSSRDSQLLGNKGARSLSTSASDRGGQPVPNAMSPTVDILNNRPVGATRASNFIPNGDNGVRASSQKVIQQFKVYKPSKHYAIGIGSGYVEKYNYKMAFPYEMFINLYHWNKVDLRPCGLKNCGNSCYANVVLQCLLFTRPLTAYLYEGFHSKACPKKEWCFMCEFEALILKVKEGKSPISPISILSHIESTGSRLGQGREEDAHEFLRCVIETMQSVCLKEAGVNTVGPLPEETTLIGLIFGGYLLSKIRCLKCHGKSERRERMMDLTVEIQGDIRTLEEALKQFTAPEILEKENKYNCPSCKSYEKAKKTLSILEAPNVLTIVLKRFQSGKNGKLNKTVRFPDILDLFPYMSGRSDKSPIYSLYAVVVHRDTNNATFSGHYVCYVRVIQGKWFNLDDSRVEPVDMETVLSERAYMLLYARCSPRAPSSIKKVSGKVPVPRETVTSKNRPSPAEDYHNWTTSDGPTSFESFDLYDKRFHPLLRVPNLDSSSDNSSLLSCSDEGSCSTESTRDSASTDDFPEYVFGEAVYSYRASPLSASDRDEAPSSTSGESGRKREEGWQDRGSLPVFDSDITKQDRELIYRSNSNKSSRSGSKEADLQRLGPSDVKFSVAQRRFSRERTEETFH